MRLACWFRRRAETIFLNNSRQEKKQRALEKSVIAITSTRDACATLCFGNILLDARSNLCYTQVNVEQDHHFDGDGCRAFHGSGRSRRAIMHPLEHGKSKSLSVKLLR